jgi:hypothetical protein
MKNYFDQNFWPYCRPEKWDLVTTKEIPWLRKVQKNCPEYFKVLRLKNREEIKRLLSMRNTYYSYSSTAGSRVELTELYFTIDDKVHKLPGCDEVWEFGASHSPDEERDNSVPLWKELDPHIQPDMGDVLIVIKDYEYKTYNEYLDDTQILIVKVNGEDVAYAINEIERDLEDEVATECQQ